MKDPAPRFGRAGIVVATLVLTLGALGAAAWKGSVWRAARPMPTPMQGATTVKPTPAAEFQVGLEPAVNVHAEPPPLPDGAPTEVAFRPEAASEAAGLPVSGIEAGRPLHGHPPAQASLANALAGLDPYIKKGFGLRDKVWEGEITSDEAKAISCQFFKGNDYCFCVGTDARGSRLSLQFYSDDGTSADAEQSAPELAAGAIATACLRCRQTGTYVVVVKLEATLQEKVPWGMVSAYR